MNRPSDDDRRPDERRTENERPGPRTSEQQPASTDDADDVLRHEHDLAVANDCGPTDDDADPPGTPEQPARP